jgi:hypothetical protein
VPIGSTPSRGAARRLESRLSYEAIRWAIAQPVSKSSAKFVLVAMADCVNGDQEEMTCWPSYKHLTERTGQDVKTVEAGLRRLRDAGFIADTGERKGMTGQVIVYQLKTPEIGAVETDGKTPVFPVKTPVFPIKDPQISHERPPKTGDGTSKGTSKGTKKEPVIDARLSEIPPNLLSDYMAVRKAKKAGVFTSTAIDGMQREAEKAGLSLEDAMRACAEFGWQGFNAGWYEQRTAKTGKQMALEEANRKVAQIWAGAI